MSRRCPRDGCGRTVRDEFLLCLPDWRLVPLPLQRAVYAAWNGGKGLGSDALLDAQRAAIASVNGEGGGVS